jgi:lipopolysaccharide transport system permease protein
MSDDNVILYQPEASREGFLGTWREMAHNAASSRGLTWRLFVRDFSVRYKQTLLGPAWAVLTPLITVAAFMALNQSGVMSLGESSVPYAVFAMVGLTVWTLFSGGLAGASRSLVQASSFISKIKFPREALVLSSQGTVVIDFLIRCALTAGVFAWHGVIPQWTIVFVPLALMPLVLITLGVGLGLALLNAVVRDIEHGVTVVVGLFFFLTPVMYQPPTAGLLARLTAYNPLAVVIQSVRDLVFAGTLSQPLALAVVAVASLAVFLASWRTFFVLETLVAERI